MSIDERSRHALYLRLEDVLGPDEASTLMEHLPPVGWADVATKRDLDQGLALTRAELMTDMAAGFTAVRDEIHSLTRAMFISIVTIVFTMAALTFALAR